MYILVKLFYFITNKIERAILDSFPRYYRNLIN